MSPVVEFVRICSVAVLVVTLTVLGARVNRWWCSRWRCLLPAAGTGTVALLVAIGNIDALLHERPGGMATFSIAAASVALLMQALTVGLGCSHPAADHPAGGAYVDYDPASRSRC